MCGIAGYIDRTGLPVKPFVITTMTEAVRHRGPDGEGHEIYANVALGHRRLAIVDLSVSGGQPMNYGLKNRYSIIFNGEIYNHVELRDELRAEGMTFSTRTDTEVILAAYAKWGNKCVDRLNGMWAFAILDKSSKTLFCSRDRYGIKPFYYIDSEKVFAFGSEIRQLLPHVPARLANRELLVDFILSGTADHTENTFFLGIKKLLPGHNLTYDLQNNQYTIESYYSIGANPPTSPDTAEKAINAYRSSLISSISLHLRADVPVGTCLSGGLDSSSVAATAATILRQQGRASFHAITAVSEQADNDESKYAEQVVRHAGLKWLTCQPSYEDFIDTLPQVVLAQEEPFTSPSLTMQYFVMKTARENRIPVLLDGQGGDETLLGYEKYYVAHLVTTLRDAGVRAAWKALRDTRKHNSNMSFRTIAKYLTGSLMPRTRYHYYKWRNSYVKADYGLPAHIRTFAHAAKDESAIQKLELSSTNLPLLLRYEDKNSMHHSIEARLPFLDYRTVELALAIPKGLKINQGWSKWILRKSMEDSLPRSIVWRKNKLGFEAPEKTWLKKHDPVMFHAIVSSSILASLCDLDKLKKRYTKLDNRTRWRLYSIAMWERTFNVAL